VDAALLERDADPFFLHPHNAAWHVASIRRQDQDEVLGDSNWAYYVEHCAGTRQIANHAIGRAVAELNRSSPQYAMATGRPLFHMRQPYFFGANQASVTVLSMTCR
jgi:hypothetical protein